MNITELLEDIFHIILLTEFVTGIGLWTTWIIKNKRHYGYAIAPLLFFVHAMLYFILSLTGIITTELQQVWADLVSIHGTTILLFTVYTVLNTPSILIEKCEWDFSETYKMEDYSDGKQ